MLVLCVKFCVKAKTERNNSMPVNVRALIVSVLSCYFALSGVIVKMYVFELSNLFV